MMNSKHHGWSKRTREKYVFLRDLNVLHIHSTFSEHFKSFFLSWMIIQTLEMRKSWFNKWMRELRLVSVHQPRSDMFRKEATTVALLISSQSYARDLAWAKKKESWIVALFWWKSFFVHFIWKSRSHRLEIYFCSLSVSTCSQWTYLIWTPQAICDVLSIEWWEKLPKTPKYRWAEPQQSHQLINSVPCHTDVVIYANMSCNQVVNSEVGHFCIVLELVVVAHEVE